jgi:hypothetical protein
MRRGEVKIFLFLLFFLELFKNLNSGSANKANVSEGPLFVLVLKFHFFLNITSYIRINISREIFERTDRKISKKEKIGRPRFRGAILLIYFTGTLCTT